MLTFTQVFKVFYEIPLHLRKIGKPETISQAEPKRSGSRAARAPKSQRIKEIESGEHNDIIYIYYSL